MRKHNYVIGYEGERQCIYGKDKDNKSEFCDPMTLFQAKQSVKKTFCFFNNGYLRKTCVYKLVKVKE